MNRLAVSISILIVMAAGCTSAVIATNSITKDMSHHIDLIEESFRRGEYERSVDLAEELQDMWDDMMDYSILINDLGHAVEITSSLAEIISFAEEENDEIYASCDRAQAQIEMLREMQTPTFWKII